jgi:hypothetical protein
MSAAVRIQARSRQPVDGEVAEWSNAAVLKTVEPKGSGGSNPSLSAIPRSIAVHSHPLYPVKHYIFRR